ncbi:GNAT family N-acetyltransferase [Thermaerobacillus caldiproteolyticus]|uniref:GNAT superfamily N-acetyltransferase n=1 Tax=Thermaerobacillus caldiproteolyticus TaxID=247480 RepID=A0A7V9Z8G9_9BACL|nr:GNAT family N-acetyltransferase [Anoxybacillus caldiproteolyticus]MBA2875924.1 GNAT superfamily N-acetyltransferase [Anoxybacillus caldiproteolyticus]QPA32434.1 GNAT family N-acetyltransferase [Anoxybacillus caldiproteolyticus]
MQIRHVSPHDYNDIISVLNDWWGGRQMVDMLPKLFFIHFQNTSFVAIEQEQIIGFLIGFVSQTYPEEAYIHFVGVHPDYRKRKIASRLYERFFETVKEKGCRLVRCVTSPVNRTSIAFHSRMGFDIEKGDQEIEGVSVFTNYDGRGGHRVLFVKHLQDGGRNGDERSVSAGYQAAK